MAYIKYAGEEAVGRIADYVNKKLTFASSMPESPETNTIVMYVGSTGASYVQGGIYLYDGTNWNMINSIKEMELTLAEYQALPSATKLNGTNYFVTDAGGDGGSEVVQGYLNPADGKFYEESTYETEIIPNVDKLYIDLSTNRIFRYDSTEQAYIAISGGGGGSYTAGFGINITNDEIETTDFVGTQEEWDALSASEKAKFDFINITNDQSAVTLNPGHSIVDNAGVEKTQREKLKFEGFNVTDDSTNEITKVAEIPYTAGDGIDITSKEVSVTADRPATFVGTTQEWDALTTAEKAQYKVVNLTNDIAGGELPVVDVVQDGNLNPVTSNAVYDATLNITRQDFSSTYNTEYITSSSPEPGCYAIKNGLCKEVGIIFSFKDNVTIPANTILFTLSSDFYPSIASSAGMNYIHGIITQGLSTDVIPILITADGNIRLQHNTVVPASSSPYKWCQGTITYV